MKHDVSVEQLRLSIRRWRALALSALTVLIAAGLFLAAERAQAERLALIILLCTPAIARRRHIWRGGERHLSPSA